MVGCGSGLSKAICGRWEHGRDDTKAQPCSDRRLPLSALVVAADESFAVKGSLIRQGKDFTTRHVWGDKRRSARQLLWRV